MFVTDNNLIYQQNRNAATAFTAIKRLIDILRIFFFCKYLISFDWKVGVYLYVQCLKQGIHQIGSITATTNVILAE